jgi:hypothetical protein
MSFFFKHGKKLGQVLPEQMEVARKEVIAAWLKSDSVLNWGIVKQKCTEKAMSDVLVAKNSLFLYTI